MKVVILAGGFGSRLSEETHLKPKPMVEIGGQPILWHIMKIYWAHGLKDFIICTGYKAYEIKEYFANYFMRMSDVTFDMENNSMHIHERRSEPWRVTLVDTGENTMTGGRLKRVSQYVDGETFCFTYGDGVGNVDITALIDYHREQGTQATITGVQPPERYGTMQIEGRKVTDFREKPMNSGRWINGGFFVLEPSVFGRIAGNDTTWEREPLESLVREGELSVYKHKGFWRPMDTLRDKMQLEELWARNQAPWKSW